MPISDRYHAITSRARLLAIAPLTCLLLAQPLAAQTRSALAEAELQRRANNAQEAQELLKKGDESYEAGRWKDAVAAYTGARELLPDAPATATLRDAATERLVQASVELARQERRFGDVEGAKETVAKVLDSSVAPGDTSAAQVEDELNDPIRTNPAATLEHGKDVEQVRMLLYKAEGYKNLGEFRKAGLTFEDVLRIDPTNKAARRGMEQVTNIRTDYYRAAHDHFRSEMLADVDKAWELQVRPTISIPDAIGPADNGVADERMLISNKLDRLILPSVDFEGTNIQEALDYLRAQSIKLDTFETDPARKGVNFVLDLGAADSEAAKGVMATPINISLRNVPMSQVLSYIGEITRTTYAPQQFAVVVHALGAKSAEMVTRTYRVPPDFLSSGGAAAGGEGELDPFAEDKPGEGLLTRKMDAITVLKGLGVTFPEGSTAVFNPGNSTLRVINTIDNHSLVEQAVDQAQNTQPTMVTVQVRMIKTQERTLKELGFDWLLSDFRLGGDGLTPGIPVGHLSGGTQNPANLADVALPPGEYFRNALTAGNRSGTEAITGDAIDARILQQQLGFAPGAARAPGVLWANGILNNTNLTMLMRGLDQKKGVDFVVSPSTVTRSGQQSTIEIIREFIYPEEYEPPELPNTVGGGDDIIDLDTGDIFTEPAPLVPITPATPTSFTKRDVGVVLDVLPTVSGDRHYVDIALKPSLTDFDGFINYGTPITSAAPGGIAGNLGITPASTVVLTSNEILMPVFSVMKTETNLTIQDGHTLVIGGMMESRVQAFEDKTKFFGDIPVIGRMFQNEGYAPVRTAIVFLVTVKVLDPSGETPRGN
ncbi:type II and III secretion system protein [Luteolibacter sp. GHJ8]|uniref:Type II and III secretion system protein n=1 Tax=Luteolibacter rhizosphaerae TaxID=2989719 RepID=A0ABT3FY45_9BACT|nr:Amuc_1098 family type IV pilus outer membrane protein [Luteolibacter rhizosphaerae]MCW1912503.1 type II and III secretion system protein [Luteolibacter rhizosphaerae]